MGNMVKQLFSSLFVSMTVTCLFVSADHSANGMTKEPGHMKKFGAGRPNHPIDETIGFPPPQEFFREYVSVLKPLKMTGAAKMSEAFNLWTDEYFSSLEALDEEEVLIESRKKENRTNPTSFMSLREFVRIYNSTDQYLVNSVPGALKADMIVPCSVQCEAILEGTLVDALMWFSSGGTKSVVHTDAVENINCLLRGEKELVMVDPELYGDKVDLDHPEGSYADIDVDAVDFTKYPDLADVEYFHVNVSAGDCLYIPYRWIHQVRSYGSNLAVNLWWDHHKTLDIDVSTCPSKCDLDLTLDKVNFIGFKTALDSANSLKDHLEQVLGIHSTISLEKFVDSFLGDDEPDEMVSGNGYKDLLQKLFKVFDINRDSVLTREELAEANSDAWQSGLNILKMLDAVLFDSEEEMGQVNAEHLHKVDNSDEVRDEL